MPPALTVTRPLVEAFAALLADPWPCRKPREVKVPQNVRYVQRNFWHTQDYAKRWRTTRDSLYQQLREQFPLEFSDIRFREAGWQGKLSPEEQALYWRLKYDLLHAENSLRFWAGYERQEQALLKQYGLAE